LDLAYLGAGQVDKFGNVNVSHLGAFVTGCGGFINITQNAKKLFFCGSMTAKGLKIKTGDGKLTIVSEGQERKFIDKVRQVTFSGEYAVSVRQPTMYITERAVFELRSDGLHLIEAAPGIDVEKDILAQMDFRPQVETPLKLMDARIFTDAPMNLKNQ
jgi:propionate CoA-transferase